MKKIGTCILLIFGLLQAGCRSSPEKTEDTLSELPTMVYPKFRWWMSPDHADVARFTSPSFQWPSKKHQIFEVRVAKDKDFTKEVAHRKDIPFSLINLHQELSSGLWYWQYKARGDDWSEVASFIVNDASIDFVPPHLIAFASLFPGLIRG